jgi:RHS repeat-associated protein
MTLEGTTVDYEYDAADRQTRQTSSFGAVQMTYDADGHMTQLTRPNGSRTVARFDVADQLTGLTTAAGAKTLASFDYTYDDVGNVERRVQAVGQTSTTDYTYDPLRRLTRSAGGLLPSTYTYDAAGNRLTWAAPDDPQTPKPRDPFVQTNAFDAASQLITSREVRENGGATFVDVTTNQYDRNGNRLRTDTVAQAPGQSSGTGYDYDAENRLIAQAPIGDRPDRGNGNGQRTNTRSYDALGRLVTETTGTATKTWTSDGLRPVLAGSSAGASFYMRDSAGELLAERTPIAGSGWFVTDALGSIMGVTDSKAALKRPTTYSDYGFNLQTSGSAFGFGGELADSLLPPGNGIGNDTPVLNHYYARSYDPITATWLQRDPIGITPEAPETFAAYQFVNGNPSSNTDVFGYSSDDIGAWLQGGSRATTQLLQPTASAAYVQPTVSTSQLQPTVSAQYLQPTANPFSYRRNPAAYAQVGAMNNPGSQLHRLRVESQPRLSIGLKVVLGGVWNQYVNNWNGFVGERLGLIGTLGSIGEWQTGVYVNGPKITTYERAKPGMTTINHNVRSANLAVGVLGFGVGVIDAPSNWRDFTAADSSTADRVTGGLGLAGTTTSGVALGAAATGVGAVTTGVVAAGVGALGTGAYIGKTIGESPWWDRNVTTHIYDFSRDRGWLP